MTDPAPRLPWRASKVTDLAAHPAPYLTTAERAELVASCPQPYRATLDTIIGLAYRTGRLFATRDRLVTETGLHWATVKRHRAWLVDHGYLTFQGGGRRGHGAARYLIVKRADRQPGGPPAAWARIADPDLRADVLHLPLGELST